MNYCEAIAAVWKYPSALEDELEAHAELLGSFWPRVYGDAGLVLDYVRATALGERELLQRLTEVRDSAARTTCPVFQRVRRLPLVLRRSQSGGVRYYPVGDDHDVGPQPGTGIVYRVGQAFDEAVSFPAPAGLVGGLLLANALTAPTVLWTEGLEFAIDRVRGMVVFPDDPFQNPLLTPEPVPIAPDDLQIPLWLYEADLDADRVNRHLAYQLGVELPSGTAHKDVLNALLDCVTQGTTVEGLRLCLDELTDAPRALGDEEVVDVYTESDRKWVLTNQNVYRFGYGATPLVQPGQKVRAGDYLADTAVLYELSAGHGPDLASLTLSAEFLEGVSGPLTFGTAPVPLIVSTQNGYTRLDWELGGAPADVAAFFDQLHARGVARGATLANHLDTRATPVGQPDDRFLPPTIQPLRFLYQNVLRGNALVAVLKPSGFGPDALGVDYLWVLRKVLSPHTALLIVTL